MRVTEERSAEPAWDDVAFYRIDFRPHIDGNFVNFYTTIETQRSLGETKNLACECTRAIAEWLLLNRSQFGRNDAFQIIVGWAKSVRTTGRHIIKDGGKWMEVAQIAKEEKELRFMREWESGIKFAND